MNDEVITVTDLAVKLGELWYSEYCSWTIRFDEGAGTCAPWEIHLEWADESCVTHHADWVTYTWQFYGNTVEEALSNAIEWCEGLLPFERCGACDGAGEYNRRDEKVTCEACKGSGLERDVVQSS